MMAQPKVPKGAAYQQQLKQLQDSLQRLQNSLNKLKLQQNKDLNYRNEKGDRLEKWEQKDYRYDALWQAKELFVDLQEVDELPLKVGASLLDSIPEIATEAVEGKKPKGQLQS